MFTNINNYLWICQVIKKKLSHTTGKLLYVSYQSTFFISLLYSYAVKKQFLLKQSLALYFALLLEVLM